MAQRVDNQIQPTARPVQAFIEPVRVNVVEPARPAQLPGFGQLQAVQQGATPSVQGYNLLEKLAGDLESFNRQLTPALQQIGLQSADDRMRAGEARARAEALQGMVQNDVAMEGAEANRNKANRALAKRDLRAAEIMALINPYEQMGYERGKARLAGAEVAVGLPEYVRQNSGQIDYTTPDQGQGATRQLADQYTTALMQRYGLTADNPMAQRFVLPEVEKARERVGLEIAKDRSGFLRSQRIDQTTALVRGTWATAKSTGSIEWNGQTYLRDDPIPERRRLFPYALRARMQELIGLATRNGVFGGEAREIQGKIYDRLNAEGWYGLDGLQTFINSLESTDKLLDPATGKEVIDPSTGKATYLTLGSIYQQEDIENEIKYTQARAAVRRVNKENEIVKMEAYLYNAIGGKVPGPEREAARTVAAAEYWNANGDTLQAAGVTLLDLQKKVQEIGKVSADLYFEDQPDPGMPDRELAGLSQIRGTNWNANTAYRRGQQLAQHFRDPKEGGKFQIRWNNEVAKLDKENSSMVGYKEPRDSAVNQWVNVNLNTYYGASTQRNQGDRSASRSRQWQAAIPYVNSALMQAEAKKGSRLNDAEVRKITTDELGKYGGGPSGDKQKDWLFPGSKFTDTPGVTPRTSMRNHGIGPAQGAPRSSGAMPAPATASPPPPRVYGLGELDSIPDRKLALRNYEKQPVLSAGAVDQLIQAVANNRPWPKQFERAWRDAGAMNAGEFIMRQIEKYPGSFELPPELQRKIRTRASIQAGSSDYMVSLQAAQQRFPQLAALAGGVLDVVTGARPASAAIRYEGGGGASTVSHPTLGRLGSGRMVSAPAGYCVTAVWDSMAANGIPRPAGTDRDRGNNPRGFASQLVRQYGWQSLPGLGQAQKIQSPYGAFGVNVIPEREYLAAVRSGRIPSGALVFSTVHGGWQGTAPGSKGYDVAIARNGGQNLWNGYLSGTDVYRGGATHRIVLIPAGASTGNLASN